MTDFNNDRPLTVPKEHVIVPRTPILRQSNLDCLNNDCDCENVTIDGHVIVSLGPCETPGCDDGENEQRERTATNATHSHLPRIKKIGFFSKLLENHKPRLIKFVMVTLSGACGAFFYWIINISGMSALNLSICSNTTV